MRSLLLGLDVSPRRLGWGLVDLVTGEPVACGCERLWPDPEVPVEWTRQRRLVHEALTAAHWSHDGSPCEIQAVYIEDTAGAGKYRQHDAGRAQGIVEAEVERRWPHAPIEHLKPAEWKQGAGLPGNASKGAVMTEAMRIQYNLDHPAKYVLDLSFQDAADALLIAVAGQRRNGETWERVVERGEAG